MSEEITFWRCQGAKDMINNFKENFKNEIKTDLIKETYYKQIYKKILNMNKLGNIWIKILESNNRSILPDDKEKRDGII